MSVKNVLTICCYYAKPLTVPKSSQGALEAIAEKAMEKETGARALRAIIEEFMLDIMYEVPKDDNIGRVTITREYIEGTGGPIIDIRSNSLEHPDTPTALPPPHSP